MDVAHFLFGIFGRFNTLSSFAGVSLIFSCYPDGSFSCSVLASELLVYLFLIVLLSCIGNASALFLFLAPVYALHDFLLPSPLSLS